MAFGDGDLCSDGLLPLVLLTGALDIGGNIFFVLATHVGRLDVASVLSAQDSAVTVLLAAILLKERLTRLQGLGILLALVAIVLIFYVIYCCAI